MGSLSPAHRRALMIFCAMAAAGGLVYGELRAPGPQAVSSAEVVPFLSPRSIMVITQAPSDAALAVQVRDGFSVPVPATAKPADADAFAADYVSGAHAVLAQKRLQAWAMVVGAVIGACAVAFVALLGLSRRGTAA